MNDWNGEADSHAPELTQGQPEAAGTNKRARQQHHADELYGLHNHIVLNDLLKRHLHLDKGFGL